MFIPGRPQGAVMGQSREAYVPAGGASLPRGQSNLIGLVLIIGMTVVGMTTILAFGTSALVDSQASSEVDRAGQAMGKLDSKISYTALGSSAQQRVSLPRSGSGATFKLDEDAGWMNITIRNATDNSVRIRVLNETMGAIIYENDRQGVSIAVQGGGVWRQEGNGTSMVSPPEFHYWSREGDPTLTLPLVVLQGSGTINGDVRVSKSGPTITKYPVPGDPDKSNPLTEGEVNITISSEYYRSWGAFFTDRTDGNVSYDHDRNVAMITLVIPYDDEKEISSAVESTNAGDDMELQGSGTGPAFVDSYNSSEGDYSSSKSNNGTIRLAGDVDLSGNAKVFGDIYSGGHVSISGTSEVDGWVYWTTGFSSHSPCPCDGDSQISGIETSGSSTNRVLEKLAELEESNDNDFASNISGESLVAGDVWLNASGNGGDKRSYYLSGDTTISDELVIDTSDGPVILGIDGDLTVEGTITVKGDNRTALWVGGDEITIDKGGTVHVPGDVSTRLWVYGTGDAEVSVKGSQANPANFTGVLYVPSGPGEDGVVDVDHGNVWGALVVGEVDIDAYGDVHYDKALKGEKAFALEPNRTSVPRITYLHISVNKVNVSDA